MHSRCGCGYLSSDRPCELTCLECGAPCCPACTFLFEAATYCVRCAESILGLTVARTEAGADVPRG